jgi:hypothetical protein
MQLAGDTIAAFRLRALQRGYPMSERTISLQGPASKGATVSASALRDLLDVLIEGCQRSVRLRWEGRSTAPGQVPRWIEAAAAFDLRQLREGSTQLVLDAPPVRSIAEEASGQVPLLPAVGDTASALDLFHDGLADAIGGNLESDCFDGPLLETFGRLRRVLEHGFERIDFGDGSELTVDRASLDRLGELEAHVPEPRHVRRHLPGHWRIVAERRPWLDRRSQIPIVPTSCCTTIRPPHLVADTKYKRDTGLPSNPDASQALADCRALRLRRAVLLCPDINHPWPKVETACTR